MQQRPDALVLSMHILMLGVPAILLARAINTYVDDVWTRISVNALVAACIVSFFPDVIVQHLIDRTFAGTVAITVFLSAQTWR